MTTDEMLRQAAYLLTYASFEDDAEGDGFGEERHSDADKLLWQIHEYLLDKNPSTSIDSEEVDKSTQKRLAIQKALKPMTGEECWELISEDYRMEEYGDAAYELIRKAEKHHGIGGEE